MRKWTHEAKNRLSEKIDLEVEQRHRKVKETKLLQAEKVVKVEPVEVQIDTMSTTIDTAPVTDEPKKFFTEEELEAIKLE